MVKNRAEKQNARTIKARTGLTYPRAQARLRAGQEPVSPSLFLGFSPDGNKVTHRPGKGTVLAIGGYSGSGKSVLMHRLAVEAAYVASVYIIDVAKGGADYLDIRGELSALETTAAGALALVRTLTGTKHTASVLFVDYIDYTTSPEGIPGFREALQALSDSGMPIIVGGQLPHRALPAALMERADRILIGKTDSRARQRMLRNPDAPVLGDRYKAVYETADSTVEVTLPPGDSVREPRYSFTFGTDAAGSLAVFTPALDGNLLVTGRPGAGKTWLLQALAVDAAKSMDVHVSSTGSYHLEFGVHAPGAMSTATSLAATADMLDELMLEAERRQWLSSWEASGGSAAPETRPILIVLDEFADLIRNEPYATMAECPPEDREARTRIAVAVGKIARAGRAAGVSLVLASQTADVLQLIPGSGDLKVDLSCLVLGDLEPSKRPLTELRDPELQALRPGNRQGAYEPLGRHGGMVNIDLP